ncbi:hypothetical protein V6Z12_D09G032600 [Gossypium hirsutum]
MLFGILRSNPDLVTFRSTLMLLLIFGSYGKIEPRGTQIFFNI